MAAEFLLLSTLRPRIKVDRKVMQSASASLFICTGRTNGPHVTDFQRNKNIKREIYFLGNLNDEQKYYLDVYLV